MFQIAELEQEKASVERKIRIQKAVDILVDHVKKNVRYLRGFSLDQATEVVGEDIEDLSSEELKIAWKVVTQRNCYICFYFSITHWDSHPDDHNCSLRDHEPDHIFCQGCDDWTPQYKFDCPHCGNRLSFSLNRWHNWIKEHGIICEKCGKVSKAPIPSYKNREDHSTSKVCECCQRDLPLYEFRSTKGNRIWRKCRFCRSKRGQIEPFLENFPSQ